ncbi:uncharacterized protein DUF3276 [Anseongella ginsenosidimutans]|uniref:Uncharacterized protein DUF3276 n=1 Tax=Anseongella ginsenosidimutans TaxID=496056 RepID=A0A4R3KK26_9SPHI|nr:UPF0758 domain-containing protein [Anseongella ginsenosidimutans]QEC53612.1 DUF3276 family protein [Anseongella ginsenosidimutans]TCS83957.1 uncharacterized protein DUF3276 [Anseongella ginsenosidimutans]
MKNIILVSEYFSSGRRHYFLDFKRASNGSVYLKIARSDEKGDGTYERRDLVVFEEDLECLIQAFSYLFYAASYHQEGEVRVVDLKRKREAQGSGIKDWDEQDRPREKMLENGAVSMSDADLLAMLIGSGTPKESAVGLAGRILEDVDFNLERLRRMSYQELCAFPGMGMAKSCTILAALELGRRLATDLF